MVHVDASVKFEADDSVTIAASRSALVELGRELSTGDSTVIQLPPSDAAPPYVASARRIRVVIDTAPGLSVAKAGDELLISGVPGALELLGRNIARLGSDPAALGDHMHIEYFPDHFYLRPEARPLLVEAV